MKTTLVLYTKGDIKQFKDFPNRENCMFVNTRYRNLSANTQGMRFTTVIINDLSVSLEDEEIANSRQVSVELFETLTDIVENNNVT